MALKRLSTGEMIDLTKPWLNPEHPAHQLLDKIPLAQPLLPLVQAVYQQLLATQPKASSSRLAELSQQAAQSDDRHDDLIRALFYLLTGHALLTADPVQRARYLALRDRVLPEGLSATTKSYREEAGEVVLLEARIDPDTKAFLDTIPLPDDRTLSAVTDELGAVGRRLGQIEDERAREESRIVQAPSGSDVIAIRNQWIRVVNALTGIIALAQLSDADRTLLLDPLTSAEQAADRRAARRKPDPAPTTDPPTPPQSA